MSSSYLLACGERIEVGSRPLLMGVVNASPDSFSDGGQFNTLKRQLEHAKRLVKDGAEILDIGGESAVTNRPAVELQEEIARVVPLIGAITNELDVTISVDTYKSQVAEAALAAGAKIINDVSGLRDPKLAQLCASSGAGLVVMHTRAAPKQRMQDPDLYSSGVIEDVDRFITQQIALANSAGVAAEQIVIDPGPDFAKTPAQTVAMLRQLDRLDHLDRPLLLAISRKDFIGAITQRPPRERLAGTLAALAYGMRSGGRIYRVHDVAAAHEFIDVIETLDGRMQLADEYLLEDSLRWQTADKQLS